MTSRWIKWVVGVLCVAVIVGVFYFPILRRRLQAAAKLQQQTAEQARRELTQAVPINPGEPRVKAKLYWASGNSDGMLVDSTVELPLSNDWPAAILLRPPMLPYFRVQMCLQAYLLISLTRLVASKLVRYAT